MILLLKCCNLSIVYVGLLGTNSAAEQSNEDKLSNLSLDRGYTPYISSIVSLVYAIESPTILTLFYKF